MHDKKRAFTLVELLVVIGIVAVLMGILLPTLTLVRASARATECGSNLHQIGVAVQIYLNTWQSRIPNNSYTIGDDPQAIQPPPPAGTLGASYATQRGYLSTANLEWFDIVAETLGWNGKRTVAARYGANEQDLFQKRTRYLWCADVDESAQDASMRATNYGICRNVSKAYNWQGTPASGAIGPLDFLRVGDVRQPTDIVFLAEGRFWHSHADAYDITNESLGNVSKYFAPTPAAIHHHGLNYLFFDWHVSRTDMPPHSMGGELGTFYTSDGTSFSVSPADDSAFRNQL